MTTPQPLNCINCKHREVNSNDDYYCTVIGDFIAGEIEMFTTALVGCASHSSATHTPAAPEERLCDECNILELEEKIMNLEQDLRDATKDERERVLDELADPMKSLLVAIGKTYDESMKLPGDYHADLGESIQVCFDKFKNLREAIEKSLRGGDP